MEASVAHEWEQCTLDIQNAHALLGLPFFCSFLSHYSSFWMADAAWLLQSSEALVQSQCSQISCIFYRKYP